MARSTHIPARPFDFQSKQPDTYKQPVHHHGFSWSPREGLNIQLRPSASYFRHSATTLHLWERWEGDNILPRMKRVKDCESFKASARRKRSLKTSWPPAFITHYSLSFIPTGKSSFDIKHPCILGRHKKKSTLPCPEIAAFFSCHLTSLYFWNQICPQSNCIFRAGEMLVWIIDSHLYEAHRIRRAAGNFVNWALFAALPEKCSSSFAKCVHSLMSHYGPGII